MLPLMTELTMAFLSSGVRCLYWRSTKVGLRFLGVVVTPRSIGSASTAVAVLPQSGPLHLNSQPVLRKRPPDQFGSVTLCGLGGVHQCSFPKGSGGPPVPCILYTSCRLLRLALDSVHLWSAIVRAWFRRPTCWVPLEALHLVAPSCTSPLCPGQHWTRFHPQVRVSIPDTSSPRRCGPLNSHAVG